MKLLQAVVECVNGHSYEVSLLDNGFVDYICPVCMSKYFRITKMYAPPNDVDEQRADNKPSMQVCPKCSMGIIGFTEYRCVNGQCDYRGRGKPAHIG